MDNALRQYLEDIRLLEADAYCLRQTIPSLIEEEYYSPNLIQIKTFLEEYGSKRKYLSEEDKPVEPEVAPKKRSTGEIMKDAIGIFGAVLSVSVVQACYDSLLIGYLSILSEVFIVFLLIRIMKYIGWRVSRSSNSKEKRLEYQKSMEDYELSREYDRKYQQIRDTNQGRLEVAKATNQARTHRNELIRIQRDALNQRLLEIENTLVELYSKNIIYPRYRGFIPVTMFCEYMDSGRRTVLEGTNGMYDLYESELTARKIVNALGEVNQNLKTISQQIGSIDSKLDGVMQNQWMLYESCSKGMQTSHQILDALQSQRYSLSKANEHLSSIEEAQRIIAENSQIEKDRERALLHIARNNWE